jgi:hypothetical protein
LSLNTILATAPLTTTNYILKATGTALGNSIIYDNGTNVGIGNTNTSFTLDVSGTGRFTGIVTFGSTLSNGTYAYTLPSATGTLALTSAIPANPVGGTGTINTIPKFTASSTIGDSAITDDGTTVTLVSRALAGTSATFSSTNTATAFIPSGATVPTNGMYLSAANTLNFATNSTNRLTITSAGNVGLGVTPSAWYSSEGYNALQVGNASLFGRNSTNSELYLSSNTFENSSGNPTYITSDFATRYAQNDGVHSWLTAPSGTAGNAISFTQAMTLTAGGNVGIGTSTPAAILHTQVTNAGAESKGLIIQNVGNTSSTAISLIFSPHESTSSPETLAKITAIRTATSFAPTDLAFYTYNNGLAERMRITSGGNVGIGTSTPTGTYGKLSVAGGISILDDNNAKFEIGRYSSGAPNSYIKIGTNSGSLRITNAADTIDLVSFFNSGFTFFGTIPSVTNYLKYNFNVGTDQNIGFRSSSSIARLEATNDAVSANVPMEFAASTFNFTGGDVGIAGNVSYGQSLKPTAAVNSGYYTIDSAATYISLGANGAVNIGGFSGMVLVTNTANGNTMLFLCGGGSAVLVSQSIGGAAGTMTNWLGSGYTFTTAYTSTANYSFQIFRTRVIA